MFGIILFLVLLFGMYFYNVYLREYFEVVRTYRSLRKLLETRDLINNHCPSFETIIQLEAQMIDYNTSFFHDGKGLTFFQRLEALATEKITGILTVLSDRLLQKK